ncbi:multiple PDZ domain protein-like [Macrosteles quadrilineatus]|uniref:multiple PDZ domain protein-like n=1 Tax=Macrosteles quadrilineatus TaxID=74068 RepID=UPI0023E12C69|nr:multiple PDZ domain protein-like [Macrosteles quadrilineatus]
MAFPTVPVCIQLTDFEVESPHLGVAPIYRTVLPPPPYNPSLYPPLYDVYPPAPASPHNLPEYVALVGIHPMHQGNGISYYKLSSDPVETIKTSNQEDNDKKIITREVILNKRDGKFGLKTAVMGKSVYVVGVREKSAAGRAGVKVADQLIKVNGTAVTGLTNDQVHDVIRRCPPYGIKFTLRSRKDYGLFKKLENMKKSFSDI